MTESMVDSTDGLMSKSILESSEGIMSKSMLESTDGLISEFIVTAVKIDQHASHGHVHCKSIFSNSGRVFSYSQCQSVAPKRCQLNGTRLYLLILL